MKATALWSVAPGIAELRDEVLPPRGADQALVRALASGISRGTERLVLAGRVPQSQWPVMRAPLMAGEFPFPVKYGYAAVGVVEAGPEALLGRRVFCLHPHQDRFLVPATMCIPIPDTVPDLRAVLAANMETAVNVLWDARPLVGERALVIGAGVVGLLVAALLARIPGLDLSVCDIDAGRAPLVQALGARFCMPDAAPDARDLIIHASADPAGLQLALSRAGFEGRILEASWYGDRAVTLPLGEAFHAQRLSIISSQVGQVAPVLRGRRTHGERLALALALLDDPGFDALLAAPVPFAALPATLPGILNGAAAQPCPTVSYSE